MTTPWLLGAQYPSSPQYGQPLNPAFVQLGMPPYSLRAIQVPYEVPLQQNFPFDFEKNGDELTGEVFLGQLSRNVTEVRIRNLILAVSNEILRVPIFVGTAVLHRRGGICAFVTVNSSAVPLLLALRDSLVLEDFCEIAWLAETEQQRELLVPFFAARTSWPRKAIVIETRVAPSPPKLIKELIREATAAKPTMGIKIDLQQFAAPSSATSVFQQASPSLLISQQQQQQFPCFPQATICGAPLQFGPSTSFFAVQLPPLSQQAPLQLDLRPMMPALPFICGICQCQMDVMQFHPTSTLRCTLCQASFLSAWGCRRCGSIIPRCLEHASS